MKRLRAFLDRLPGGHRPPTGPLTSDEESDAEALRQEANKLKQRDDGEADGPSKTDAESRS